MSAQIAQLLRRHSCSQLRPLEAIAAGQWVSAEKVTFRMPLPSPSPVKTTAVLLLQGR